MAGDERNRKFKVANFIQTDLLQKFISRNNIPDKLENKIPIEEDEEEEEIELSLGLSLNGRFGVDPERAKEIVRASSISNFMIISGEKDSKSWSLYDAALTRTCSLPTETEEEWRKRKELQSLRRMEVKRKRSEKLKNVRVVRERVDLERNCQENGNGEIVIPPIKGDGVVELNGEITPPQFSSQGSIGSQGSGGSSGVSDLESQPIGGDATEFSWICISLAIGSNLLKSIVYWSACYHQQQLSIVRWFFRNHTSSKPSKDCFSHGGWAMISK